jgi:hypothetical protein
VCSAGRTTRAEHALAPPSSFAGDKKELSKNLLKQRVEDIFTQFNAGPAQAALIVSRIKTYGVLRSANALPEALETRLHGDPQLREVILRLRPGIVIRTGSAQETTGLIDGIHALRYASPSDLKTLLINENNFFVYNEELLRAYLSDAGIPAPVPPRAFREFIKNWLAGLGPAHAPAPSALAYPAPAGSTILWDILSSSPLTIRHWEPPNRFKQIVIPTHNRPGSLRKSISALIDNLTRWDHRDVEIMVIDNSSEPANQTANQKLIGELRGQGVAIRYFGPDAYTRFIAFAADSIIDYVRTTPGRSTATFLGIQFDPGVASARETMIKTLKTKVYPFNIGGIRNLILTLMVGERFIMADDDALPVARFVPQNRIPFEWKEEGRQTHLYSAGHAKQLYREVPIDIIGAVNRNMKDDDYFCNFKPLYDEDWSASSIAKAFLKNAFDKETFQSLTKGELPQKGLALSPDFRQGSTADTPLTTTFLGVDNTTLPVLPFPAEWLEDQFLGFFREAAYQRGGVTLSGLGAVHERSIESPRNHARSLFYEMINKVLFHINSKIYETLLTQPLYRGISGAAESRRRLLLQGFANTYSSLILTVDKLRSFHYLGDLVDKYMCADIMLLQMRALNNTDMFLDLGDIDDARASFEFARQLTAHFHLREDEREPLPYNYMKTLVDTIIKAEIAPRLESAAESIAYGNLGIAALAAQPGIYARFTGVNDALPAAAAPQLSRVPAGDAAADLAFETYIKGYNILKRQEQLNTGAPRLDIPSPSTFDSAA